MMHTERPAGTDVPAPDSHETPAVAGNRGGRSVQILAIVLGVAPAYALAIWAHLTRTQPYHLREMLLYPLVFGSLSLLWMILLFTRVCGERLAALNLRPRRWFQDVAAGLVLGPALLLLFTLLNPVLAHLPRESRDVGNLIAGLAARPILLALWLGPVVWIGVAAFEETTRAFFLNRMDRVLGGRLGRAAAVVLFAAIFGIAHIYQGPAGVASTGIQSLFLGWFYYRSGRVWPLIIGHALFDSAQIVAAVSMMPK